MQMDVKRCTYFVSADASASSDDLPFAGPTSIHVYNRSHAYAITWYLLTLGRLLPAGIVIRHKRQLRH